MQIQKRKTRFLAGVLTLGTVAGALAGSALLSPAPQASAEGGTSSSATTELQLNLAPVLSVAVEDYTFDITPDENGTLVQDTHDVVVDSNSASGYKVYISTKDTDTGLKQPEGSHVTTKIQAVASEIAVDTYTADTTKNNTWGYIHDSKISGIPYDSSLNNACNVEAGEDPMSITECAAARRAAVSENSAKICETSSISDEADCELTIGIKVDKSIPSGTYSGAVVVTAVPNI